VIVVGVSPSVQLDFTPPLKTCCNCGVD